MPLNFDVTLLAQELNVEEGRSPTAYQDSEGYWTVGVGCCIDARVAGAGLPAQIIDTLLNYQIGQKAADVENALPWAAQLDPVRQRALVDLCFNMGIGKLLGFKLMLGALQRGDWQTAGAELQNSKWWGQVGRRGPIIQRMLIDGVRNNASDA